MEIINYIIIVVLGIIGFFVYDKKNRESKLEDNKNKLDTKSSESKFIESRKEELKHNIEVSDRNIKELDIKLSELDTREQELIATFSAIREQEKITYDESIAILRNIDNE